MMRVGAVTRLATLTKMRTIDRQTHREAIAIASVPLAIRQIESLKVGFNTLLEPVRDFLCDVPESPAILWINVEEGEGRVDQLLQRNEDLLTYAKTTACIAELLLVCSTELVRRSSSPCVHLRRLYACDLRRFLGEIRGFVLVLVCIRSIFSLDI